MNKRVEVLQHLSLAMNGLSRGQLPAFEQHFEAARRADERCLAYQEILAEASLDLLGDTGRARQTWQRIAHHVELQLAFLDAYELYVAGHPLAAEAAGRVLVTPQGEVLDRSSVLAFLELARYRAIDPSEAIRRHEGALADYEARWQALPTDAAGDPSAADVSRFYSESEAMVERLAVLPHGPLPMAVRSLVARRIVDAGAQRVLGFGAGGGLVETFLARLGVPTIVHVDIRSPLLEFARWRYELLGVDAEIVATAGELPPFEEPFDALVTLEVLEHLPDPPAAIDYLAGLVRAGGLVFASYSFDLVEASHLVANKAYGGGRSLELFAAAGLDEVSTVGGFVRVFRKRT